MFRKLLAAVFAIGMLSLSSVPSLAQSGDVMVYLGGGPLAGTINGAPGSTVTVPVLIIGSTGMIPSARFEITVPAPLRTLATSTCTAETVQATTGAASVYRPCEVIGWEGPNGSQIISTEIENLSSMTGFRINAWLQIEIPNATPVGSRYKLTAPSVQANGFPTISEFNINVVANAAKSNPVEPTPTRTIVAEAPLYDIDGSSLEFLIGSIKPFSFSIDYDAYPEATSASLTVYTDAGIIDVQDPLVIDMEATHICDGDNPLDKNEQSRSRQPIRTLPEFFNVSLPRWLEPDTEIRVCAEVAYFNGSKVIGVERYKSTITVSE